MTPASNIKHLISEVVALLFNSDRSDAITKAMNLLIDFFEADWVYVAMLDGENKVADFLYEVTSKWVHESKENISVISYETLPWMVGTIVAGNDIILHDINELPPEAAQDRLLLQEQGILSMLVLPLSFHGENRGLIGFDSVRIRRYWTFAEVENMRIIANLFSIIIERQATLNDIKDSHKRLLQSDTRFRLVFTNLPVGVLIYDIDGNLIDANNACEDIFETKIEEMKGLNLFNSPNAPKEIVGYLKEDRDFDLLVIYDFAKLKNYHETSIREGVKYLQIKGLILHNEENEQIGFMMIISDNTENFRKKEMEEKLQIAEEEKRKTELEMAKVREADKLKSAFLANMSHEIRTPLNAIVGFSNIMAEMDDPGERQYYQEVINNNNDLLLQLISDILDFSKIEAGVLKFKLKDVDIKLLCQDIYAIYSTREFEHLQFVFNPEAHPGLVIRTDEQRVRQIIINLVSNAYKFTMEGRIALSYKIADGFVRISVSDTGVGIAPENKENIFERFVKVDNFSQGTGLGLSICKTVVEALGGEIGVESELDVGSTFWFTLPLRSN